MVEEDDQQEKLIVPGVINNNESAISQATNCVVVVVEKRESETQTTPIISIDYNDGIDNDELVSSTTSSVKKVPSGSISEDEERKRQNSIMCRICHCEETSEEFLISPCYCSGTLRYVHQSCLQQWLKSTGI